MRVVVSKVHHVTIMEAKKHALTSGYHDRETKSNKQINQGCNYQVLLGLRVAVLVSIYLSTFLAFCGLEDSTISTPTNFTLSRTRKAEKRKVRTENERVERCNVMTRRKTSPYLSWLRHIC